MFRRKSQKSEGEMAAVTHRLGGKAWIVDTHSAGEVMAWVRREPATWQADLTSMAAHFPHWTLVGGDGNQPKRCACGGPLAPMQNGLCCVLCGKAGQARGLLWMGQLPVLARPEATFNARRDALQRAGFRETVVGGLIYLLVPPHCPGYPTLQSTTFLAA